MVLHNIKSKCGDSGFTIVELLVVIVVIGILAAITVVSYNGVTNKANTASNRSNASAVMKAVDAYFSENGFYPAATFAGINGGVVKVPTNFTLATAGNPATSSAVVSYNPTGSPATNYCIEYWDASANAQATLSRAGSSPTCP